MLRKVSRDPFLQSVRRCSTFDVANFFSNLPSKYFWNRQTVVNDARSLIFEHSPEKSLLIDEYASCETTTLYDPNSPDKWIKFHSINCHPITGKPLTAGDTSGTIIERWFYPELFAKIRRCRATILIGTTGTGMSYFQDYYMYRIAKAAADMDVNAWPADCYGSNDVPNVVCRQMGADMVTAYFINERKAFNSYKSKCCLDWFNVPGNLHLIEPRSAVFLPPSGYSKIQVLKTNSMDPKHRTRKFKKHDPVFFMPVYDLWELKRTAQFFREKYGEANAELRELYSDDKVEARFAKYNGVIRYVLPLSVKQELLHNKERADALEAAGFNLLDHISPLYDMSDALDRLMVIRVPTTGLLAYSTSDCVEFAGIDILDELLKRDEQACIAKIRARLIRWIPTIKCDYRIYEKYFLLILMHGVKWKQVVWSVNEHGDLQACAEYIVREFKATSRMDSVPAHCDMKMNTAYSCHGLFPNADVFFMDEDRNIWVFKMHTDMSESSHKIDIQAGHKKLLEHLDLSVSEAAERLHFVLVPQHSQAQHMSFDNAGVDVSLKSISMLHPPKHYKPDLSDDE